MDRSCRSVPWADIGRPGGPRRASPQSTSHDSSIHRAVACRTNRATFSYTLRIQEVSRARPRRAVGIRARRFATRRRAPHRRPRSARVPHDVTRKDTVSQYEASRRPRPAVATIKKMRELSPRRFESSRNERAPRNARARRDDGTAHTDARGDRCPRRAPGRGRRPRSRSAARSRASAKSCASSGRNARALVMTMKMAPRTPTMKMAPRTPVARRRAGRG